MKNPVHTFEAFHLNENHAFYTNTRSEELEDIDESYGVIDVVDVSKEFIAATNKHVKILMAKMPVWEELRIVFIQEANDCLGFYRTGSWTDNPLIMLCAPAIEASTKEYDVTLECAVATTLYHEFAHAVVDMDEEDGHGTFDLGDEEKLVESFAFQLWNNNEIEEDFKQSLENILGDR